MGMEIVFEVEVGILNHGGQKESVDCKFRV